MSATRFTAAVLAIMLGSGTLVRAAGPIEGYGLEGTPAEVGALAAALPAGSDRALLRLSVEAGPGAAADEAGALAAALDALAGRQVVVIAEVRESQRVDVRDGAAVDAWAERVATLVDRGQGRVRAWVVAGEAAERSPEEQAFFIKRTALAVKGVDRKALVLSADPATWPGGAIADVVAPFIDGHDAPAVPGEGTPPAPASALRHGGVADNADGAWAAAVEAAARGERAATFRMAPEAAAAHATDVARALSAALAALPADVSPTEQPPSVSFPAEVRVEATELLVASDLSTRVVFRPVMEGRLPGSAMIATFDAEPRGLRLFDPRSAEASAPRVVRSGRGFAAEVPLVRRPLVLAWERGRQDDVTADVAVSTTVDPTVDEILARHFAAQAARERAVTTYVADVSTEMRYELGASGQAFEVRVEGRYFVDETAGLREIENQRWFINGARYDPRKGRPPEMPLLQPEKVQVTPLELRLDRSYEYRLAGRDEKEGRPCWKVAFRPLVEDATAYAGTVWIDAQTYDRVAVDLVQTRLEAPVLTNEQSDRFGPVLGPDGEAWLARESRIHRTVSLLGGTVGIQMRLLFSNFRVNDPEFPALRQSALDSPHQMLRDTDEGMKYLRPTEGGGRELGETASHKMFVALGARYDNAYDGFLPLAGVNYLDYDLGGSDLQLNVFAAGAINTVSLADPSLFGSRVSIGVDAFLPFVRKNDRIDVPGSGVDEGHVVRSRIPRLDVEVSRPAGRHGRVAVTAAIARESWSRDEDTDANFVEPESNWVASLGVKGEIHARGWDARLWVQRAQRSGWEAWGVDDGSGPPPLSADAESYWKWGSNVAKTWPLSKLQTTGFDAQLLGGRDLDRFSQYEFSAFGGTRLPGFDGSGIHFDQAALLRLSYGVEVAGLFGAQVQLGVGRTWNESLPQDVLDEYGEDSDHVGLALTGNVPGPLGTIIRFDVGAALWSSDHEDAEGNWVAQLVVLKLIGR